MLLNNITALYSMANIGEEILMVRSDVIAGPMSVFEQTHLH